jgi:molybdenum cofactor biosynthesis enzyme MoaA
VLFDPINNCNIHCAYCHVPRSEEQVDEAVFARFLSGNILGTRRFQFGCGMEPTLDPRLADLMMMVNQSMARPSEALRLQTNGILLHRHDVGKLREAGLTLLTLSIDTIDRAAFARLRGGTSLPKVLRNLQTFRTSLPDVDVLFIVTVTSLNIESIDGLIGYGLSIGVTNFNLRQVFYRPESRIVDHSRMPDLVVPDAQFEDMSARMRAKYGACAKLAIQTAAGITVGLDERKKVSLLPPPPGMRIGAQHQD